MQSHDCNSLLYISGSSMKHLSELHAGLANILSLDSTPRVSVFCTSVVGLRICISNTFPVILCTSKLGTTTLHAPSCKIGVEVDLSLYYVHTRYEAE